MPLKYTKSIQVVHEPDVLICGVGCAGVAAAVAAARMGVSTLGVEQWPFAGGNITAGNVNGCCGLADMTTGELAVGGIALELLARTGRIKLPLASKKLFEPILDEKRLPTRHTKLPFAWDIELFKIEADRVLLQAGVRLLYHTKIADVVTSAGRITEVIIANKGGVSAVRPKVVVDCTGDGDVAAWAGAPFDVDPNLQAMTTEFYAINVMIPGRQELQDKCSAVLQEARRTGRMGIYGGPWLSWPAENAVRFNATRLPFNSSLPDDMTKAEIQGREDAWRMFNLWKEALPEFKDAYFMLSGPACGSRESRRISGAYTLTKDDVVTARRFDDVVVKGSWYLDRHPVDAPGHHSMFLVKAYIPYRTLLPQKLENVLVAGRCHSATAEALASSRVGVTAMGMGEAAGVAAALAVKSGKSPAEVNVTNLRAILLSQGAIL